jgi:hypothetical protein
MSTFVSIMATHENFVHAARLEDYKLLLPPMDDVDVALGYLFSISSMALYIPQGFEITKRRSTFGLSITTLFLAAVSCFCGFINILMLDFYSIKGCSVLGTQCVPHIQPLFQASLALLLLLPLYGWALRVFSIYDMDDPRNVRQFYFIASFLHCLMFLLCGPRAGP